jgi:hypothetical protein
MSTSRRSQPQFSFRLDEETAERFRDWREAEALQVQAILETLVKALVDGDLPDVRELRRNQMKRDSSK